MMPRIVALFALAATTACGASVPIDDGGGSEGSESGSESATTDPVPTDCFWNGQTIADGQTYATPDGCVTYECDAGAMIVIDDSLETVAGDLVLDNQPEVAAHTCLGVVEGSLTISGTAADLSALDQLTRVGGSLTIEAAAVTSLNGLQTLAEIDAGLVIRDNASLTQLAFQPYMSLFGDVTIENNDVLTSLAGAEFIGACVSCFDDGEATTDSGDPGGDEGGEVGSATAGEDEPSPGGTFYGNILIAENDALVDISAISNLVYAWQSVRLRGNAVLNTIAALRLQQVQGDLEIANQPALDTVSVESFASTVAVAGTTTICGNLGGVACP
ncbi:MAG TPA: hypothetical protein VG755_45205 [Nannocystaceae bacterium]|nr:hypothetical protein [Nannocystaceae bacterium]